MANDLSTLLQSFQQQQESSQAANLRRYSEAMAIYDEIIQRYRPGGEFGRAALGQLEARKIRDVGKETQQLISSGLYGTTTMGATGRRWEEAVGAPERLRLEDIQMQRLSQAQIGKAGFIERREDVGPDYGMVAQLASQAAQAPTGGGMVAGGGRTFEQMFPERAPLKSYWEQQAERRTRLGGEVPSGPTTGAPPRGVTTDPSAPTAYELAERGLTPEMPAYGTSPTGVKTYIAGMSTEQAIAAWKRRYGQTYREKLTAQKRTPAYRGYPAAM